MRLHRHTHKHTCMHSHTTCTHTYTHTSSVAAALIIWGILIQHIAASVTLPGNGRRIKAATVGVGTWVNLQLGHASWIIIGTPPESILQYENPTKSLLTLCTWHSIIQTGIEEFTVQWIYAIIHCTYMNTTHRHTHTHTHTYTLVCTCIYHSHNWLWGKTGSPVGSGDTSPIFAAACPPHQCSQDPWDERVGPYISTHIHIHTHIHIRTYIHIHTHTYTYIHIHTHTYTVQIIKC